MKLTRSRSMLAAATLLMSGASWAQLTARASVATGGAQGTDGSALPSISTDGRYVAFHAAAPNLVPGDTNAVIDVFVRDRQTGTTERVSVDSGGVQGDGPSSFPWISADGRFVVFQSEATNLVAGDTNAVFDVFLHDRVTGTTARMSVDSSGAQGNAESRYPSISGDGNHVLFLSYASNLVAADTNGVPDAFVRDRPAASTERVSVDSAGVQGNATSFQFGAPTISANGRFVAFPSQASNLVVGDTNGTGDVFVRDRLMGVTERVSVGPGGAEGNSVSYWASISGSGNEVAFWSNATNLVIGDTNGWTDIFVRDRPAGTTERASVATGGAQGNDVSLDPSISADGRTVGFYSAATNLVAADANGTYDLFVHDRTSGVTERASVDSSGAEGNGSSAYASVSGDGRFVAYGSAASNLVPGDTNGFFDVFVRDRVASGFTRTCDPGVDGVIACPCGNPPAGAGRGCNNSAATGGASLSASGIAYLATDSLVFTTSGEKPTALSIVTQWIGSSATGAVFGMGVRCTSGTFKRMYVKTAAGGSITAPNFGAGDPSVSARSAALGNVILAGQSRWYLVYYRDPVVLGGCPATSTFNATSTGRVTWSP